MTQLWSVCVTATLFTLFMCWAFYTAVRDLGHELSWLGWLYIAMGAFFAFGLSLFEGIAILYNYGLL